VKVGDQVADSVPGDATLQTHAVQKVIVTQTDRDFVDLTIKKLATTLGKAAAGLALAPPRCLARPPNIADTSTVTTTLSPSVLRRSLRPRSSMQSTAPWRSNSKPPTAPSPKSLWSGPTTNR